jgi:transposase InsO family protein
MVGRSELARMLARYRRVYRARYRHRGWQLTWFGAGRVWTMDFVERDVDLQFPAILAIRDLASGFQLAWLPVTAETAEVVIEVLGKLFQRFGAPLVLKSDNGSAFIARLLAAFLAKQFVIQLFSPRRRPSYNGAGERSHRTLELHTEAEAQRQGRPGDWSTADLEQAQTRNNDFDRPWGADGLTATGVWERRSPISEAERVEFQQTVEINRRAVRTRRGVGDDKSLNHYARAKIDREAVRDALIAHGYLTMERARKRRVERSSGDGLSLTGTWTADPSMATRSDASLPLSPDATASLTLTTPPSCSGPSLTGGLPKNLASSPHIPRASCRIDSVADAVHVPCRTQPCPTWTGNNPCHEEAIYSTI